MILFCTVTQPLVQKQSEYLIELYLNTYTVPERNTYSHTVTQKLREKEPMLSQLTVGYLDSNIKNGHGTGTNRHSQ